jgi:hypothetical protein
VARLIGVENGVAERRVVFNCDSTDRIIGEPDEQGHPVVNRPTPLREDINGVELWHFDLRGELCRDRRGDRPSHTI